MSSQQNLKIIEMNRDGFSIDEIKFELGVTTGVIENVLRAYRKSIRVKRK